MDNPYRAIPSIDALTVEARKRLTEQLADPALTTIVRSVAARARSRAKEGQPSAAEALVTEVVLLVHSLFDIRLRSVINATGVIIHTNLGRAPVSATTAAAMATAAGGSVPLEIRPDTNQRGGRMDEISDLMRALTGAEATLVVNNNAAAVLLVLSALARNREVVVSRGEAVEIGGGFRIPDVMGQSGAKLVEVGTVNRTYARDYDRAVTPQTAVLLKVHPSNFVVTGFVASAGIEELVPIGASHGVPVVVDLGSGAMVDTSRFGLSREPTIEETLVAGASVVTASGDKLLGGPQAGIISGSRDLIAQVAGHPLARAVRADKSCLAGVAATLRHYLRGDAEAVIPVLRMLGAAPSTVSARAEAVCRELRDNGVDADVVPVQATVGGGSLPGQTLTSFAVALSPDAGADAFGRRLRVNQPGLFGRIESDRVLLDLRTVLPEQDRFVVDAVLIAWRETADLGVDAG